MRMHRPSEVVAEREAWRLAAEQELQLSTILPSFILGLTLTQTLTLTLTLTLTRSSS